MIKSLIKQISILAWAFCLVCVLCLPGGALAREEAADTAGIQVGDLATVGEPSIALAGLPLASWTNLNPSNQPSTRYGHDMAYDSQSGKVILFGGSNTSGSGLNDTWAYDPAGNTWTNRSPSNSPPARSAYAMAFDSQSGKVILYGGVNINGTGYLNDTWAYDCASNTWTNRNPANPPPMRYIHAMAYDSQSGKVILFGGNGPTASTFYNDTWAYDYAGNTWTNRNPVNPPPLRYNHAMAYDSQSGKVILFGGYGVSGLLNDTWAYNYASNTWTNRNPSNPPPLRASHAMTYDGQIGQVILFGGDDGKYIGLNDTWAYDYATNGWTNCNPSNLPPGRWRLALAYDSQNGKAILFGGVNTNGTNLLNDTWALTFQTAVTLTYYLSAGWNMISVPLVLPNPSSKWHIPEGWPIYSWDAANARYSDLRYPNLVVGAGYWLKAPSAQPLTIAGPLYTGDSIAIPLAFGWNMIGTPYNQPVSYNNKVVVKNGSDVRTLDQAVTAGWIQAPLYRWTGSTYAVLASGGSFQPLAGYWVKALLRLGCSMIFVKT
ncbi:MAG: hypothetical protein NTV33_09730 [Coprothermobacterota bacterium]|nr:hypothetical protein [Coprothermobacterota bacterium]